jgi:ArsR family transcriptional regulator, arsenate/arsenite/antimonite-responsive transcriptional repressor
MNMHSYKRCTCGTRPGKKTELRQSVSKQLKIASVPSKLRILLLLADGPHCVCDLIEHTKLSQTLISHHLADLSANGLVESEKDGAFVDYSLTNKGRTLVLAIQVLNS